MAEEQIILPIDWNKDNGVNVPDRKNTFEEQFLYVLNHSGAILDEKIYWFNERHAICISEAEESDDFPVSNGYS